MQGNILGKPPYPQSDDETPILSHQTKPQALSARRINGLTQELAQQTAEQFNAQLDKYQRLMQLSATFIRLPPRPSRNSLNPNS